MKTKVKTVLQQMLHSPRRFPVETALGIAFFIIAVLNTESASWNESSAQMESCVNGDILWFFVPLMALSFWLGRVNRWAYLASFFLFVPLMALDLQPFLGTYGFVFTYVLAAILLLVGHRPMGNRFFAAHALHVITQGAFGLLITGILNLAVFAIVASVLYIFGLKMPSHLFAHILQFIWFVLAPQVCCTLIRQDEDTVTEPAKVLRLILDYILSPAVIIYTAILYIYFIKIALEWDLPKGGVAWMVMAFITAALAGRMAQSILRERHFDWFYRRFTLIAIPPLIMYWVGSLYRIRLYSFTESRFYLMVAGALMTLFVLMLWKERTRRFQLMAVIFGAAIVLFTYIPGISAKSIGLHCQKQRLQTLISDLQLTDAKTGKFREAIDVKSIKQDSLLCVKYRDLCSVIDYVKDELGPDTFYEQYGRWACSAYQFNYETVDDLEDHETWYKQQAPISVGEYNLMLPAENYKCRFNGQTVTVELREGPVVIDYPIRAIIRQDATRLHHPEQLLTYSNDSLLLVLESICIEDTIVTGVQSFDFQLFQKPALQQTLNQ